MNNKLSIYVITGAILIVNHFVVGAKPSPKTVTTVTEASEASAINEPSAYAGESWKFHPFSPKPEAPRLLDLRTLNEGRAGETGFVHVSLDGNSLLRGDGKPIRFWAVNMAKPKNFDRANFLDHLRWLASMGCNMIRWNWVDFNSREPGAKPEDVDDQEINDILWAVDEAAQHGIYSYLLTGGALHSFGGVDLSAWGIEGYNGPCAGLDDKKGQKPFGLFYINPILQRAYKGWLKELLTRPNPRTGVPLIKNPALAIVQYLSEESLLFYTFNRIPKPQLQILGRSFHQWLARKYGSIVKARNAWGENATTADMLLPDDADGGIAGFLPIYHAAGDSLGRLSAAQRNRMADQIEFLSWTMRAVYRDLTDYVQRDLGGRFLVLPGNWRPADPTLMLDAERWTYAAGDILGKNHFFNKPTSGNRSALDALTAPFDVPLVIKHVEGKPMFLSATKYHGPNACQIEEAFLMAGYGSLSGLDGVSFEAFYKDKHLRSRDAISPSPAQPNQAWTWPAAALIYRHNLVREGEVVLRENRAFEEIWREKPPQFAEYPGKDGDVAAFFVGPVRCQYEPFQQPAIANFESFIDRSAGHIRSVTGELTLNYMQKLCSINTPQAQAVYGDLATHGPVTLRDATITCRNPLAAVYLVSLDDRPLAESTRILAQANTPAMAEGNFWRVPKALVTITLNNPSIHMIRYLDAEGRVLSSESLSRTGAQATFSWSANAFYAVLENQP